MSAVPNNFIIPAFGVDFDNSKAVDGSGDVPVTLLIFGQRLATGTVDHGIPYRAFSEAEVGLKSGGGSMVHMMAKAVFANTMQVSVWVIGINDAETSTAGTKTWELTGTVSEPGGTYRVSINGEQYSIGAPLDMTGAELQAALNDVLTEAAYNLPFTSSVTTGSITLTHKNKGVVASDLDIRFNPNEGDKLPSGLSLTETAGEIVTNVPGTVDPDVNEVLSSIGDQWFNIAVNPYTDTTNMDVLETHAIDMNDGMVMRPTMFYQAVRDTRSNMITYGTESDRNSPWMVTLPAFGRQRSTFQIAAARAAATAASIQDDPGLPLHRMTLNYLRTLDNIDRWRSNERNQLALSGISTLTDELGVQTEACVTMYRKNSAGATDTSYRYENTMYILSAVRYHLVNRMQRKFARAKLADNADNLDPGQKVVTVDDIRNEAVAWARSMQGIGLFEPSTETLEQFKNLMVVSRDGNRVDLILPPELIKQLIVMSATIEFRS